MRRKRKAICSGRYSHWEARLHTDGGGHDVSGGNGVVDRNGFTLFLRVIPERKGCGPAGVYICGVEQKDFGPVEREGGVEECFAWKTERIATVPGGRGTIIEDIIECDRVWPVGGPYVAVNRDRVRLANISGWEALSTGNELTEKLYCIHASEALAVLSIEKDKNKM